MLFTTGREKGNEKFVDARKLFNLRSTRLLGEGHELSSSQTFDFTFIGGVDGKGLPDVSLIYLLNMLGCVEGIVFMRTSGIFL